MKLERNALLLSALLLVGGCASNNTNYSNPSADRALEERLRAEVAPHGPWTSGVQMAANGGVVTVTGVVPNEPDRQLIHNLVETTSGVVAVYDQLRVASAVVLPPGAAVVAPVPAPPRTAPIVVTPTPPVLPPPPGKALPGALPPPPNVEPAPVESVSAYPRVNATSNADAPIRRLVVAQFARDQVPPEWLENVTITLSDGNAHVKGLVDSQEQAQRIIASTQHTTGVGTVYDELRVRKTASTFHNQE